MQSVVHSIAGSSVHTPGADAGFCIVAPHGPPLTLPRVRQSPALPSAPLESLEPIIHPIRGERVIIDTDLTRLYGVETKLLNRAVLRNHEKFPPDFMSQLTAAEAVAATCPSPSPSMARSWPRIS